MKRFFAIVAALLGTLGGPTIGQAVSDIGLTSTTPHAVRVLPGNSVSVSVTVTNYGPDAVAPTIATTSVYLLLSGYTLSLSEPACGVLTEGALANYSYSIALPMMAAGASATCTVAVARDTSPYGASDLPLLWFADVSDDPDSTNDLVSFAVGSLIDISVAIVPVSFDLDEGGIAHGVNRLMVTNHGPSAVEDFSIGACTDFISPDFNVNGNIEGGCGDSNWQPGCNDWGFGFRMPALASGDVYSCTIAMDGITPYGGPAPFAIYTAVLSNPDTGGGSLVDIWQADNHADLVLQPVSDGIFASGFDG
jgi:hypothetical protein